MMMMGAAASVVAVVVVVVALDRPAVACSLASSLLAAVFAAAVDIFEG